MDSNIDQDSKSLDVIVNISSDAMKAYIRFLDNNSKVLPNMQEIIQILRKNGVNFGYKLDSLDGLYANPVFNKDILIAEGMKPVHGKNGKLEFHFNIDKVIHPTMLEDDRVDFRELGIINNVKKDEKLCTLVPAEQGMDGMNVRGEVEKCTSGRSAVLPKGKNSAISSDGLELFAMLDGQVVYENEKINVLSTFIVEGDVDTSVGNINFIGSVLVKGNVLSGFSIESGGNVEVLGLVEAATIKAEGNIIIRKGMHGSNKGTLISNSSIIVQYIESSIVEAKVDIKAEAIMHSFVKCGNILELVGNKGLIMGGKCRAGKEIKAKVIGSVMSIITEVEAGLDPEKKDRYRKLKEDIASHDIDLKKTDQAIAILTKIEQANQLTQERSEMKVKSIRTKVHLSTVLNSLKAEFSILEEEIQKNISGKIKVSGSIYPGVRITIGTSMMHVSQILQYCTIYRDGADVRVGPIEK